MCTCSTCASCRRTISHAPNSVCGPRWSKARTWWTATPMRRTISACTSTSCISWPAFFARGPPTNATATLPAWTRPANSTRRRFAARAALVKRFPEDVAYRFWLAAIRMSSAQLLLERRQPAEARNVLEAAVTETEPFSETHPVATSLHQVLHELYERLGEARERLGDDSGARKHGRKPRNSGRLPRTIWRMRLRPTGIGLRREDREVRLLNLTSETRQGSAASTSCPVSARLRPATAANRTRSNRVSRPTWPPGRPPIREDKRPTGPPRTAPSLAPTGRQSNR